ncbi:MAG: carbohydrate porin [Gammaproteobacteria bacterium]
MTELFRCRLTLCLLLVSPSVFADAPVASPEDDAAVRFDALYTGDLWQNTHGGVRTGGKFIGDLDLALEVNGERAWGLEGVTLFANGLFVHGGSVSGPLVGDAQTISNIEAVHQARLFELWVEKRFGHDESPSLRVGLYDLNSEFDVIDTASLFVNSSHGIGPQIAQTGLNGPSIFPVTSLSARLHWSFPQQWSAKFAALDGVPGDPGRPRSNAVRFDSKDGLLLIAEAGRAGSRLKKVAVGAWRYTVRFGEVAPPDFETAPDRVRGNAGFYALLDAQLYSEAADANQGLSGFLRLGNADDRINRFENYFGAGLVYTGALVWRPQDQLGLAVASVGNGRPYRLANDPAAVGSREVAVELTYRFAVNDWLTLQTDVQHITNPDTNPDTPNATAVALRFDIQRTFWR